MTDGLVQTGQSQFRRLAVSAFAGLCALLTGFSAGAQEANSPAAFLAAVKDSPAWKACDQYYDQVDRFSKAGKHYEIRTASMDFVKNAPKVTLRSEQERFLLVECINLANGNATYSHERIQILEKSDDQFFDNLMKDTVNNSNAAQFEYTGEIKGKYQLNENVEAGKAEFNATLEAGRAEALQKVLIGTVLVGGVVISAATANQYADPYSYNNFGSTYSGNGVNTLTNTFANFVSMMGQGYTPAPPPSQTASTGSFGTPPPQTSNVPYTVAPTQPSLKPGAANSGSSSSTLPSSSAPAPTAPESGRLVSSAPAPQTPKPADNKAAHLDLACIQVSPESEGALARLSNTCQKPAEWLWCWVQDGQNDCTPEHFSGVIKAGETTTVFGPGIGKSLRPRSVVCDMSDKEKFCSL